MESISVVYITLEARSAHRNDENVSVNMDPWMLFFLNYDTQDHLTCGTFIMWPPSKN